MIVHKFGGTSLGSAERFLAVANIIQTHLDPAPVIVVSAMSGVTNDLIRGARAAIDGDDNAYRSIKTGLLERHIQTAQTILQDRANRLDVCGFIEDRLHELERLYRSIAVLGEATLRGMDAVSAFGEVLSSHILAALLRERGLISRQVLASQLIVTDQRFGSARPDLQATRSKVAETLASQIENGLVPVITGYIGATQQGVITTLGRGGSDYSAALLGAALKASEVWIWSDVNGILTADPAIVPAAQTLPQLTYQQAETLAYYGADVLHPKTIRPLIETGITLRLLNSFDPTNPGTRIVSSNGNHSVLHPAIISTTGLTRLSIGSADESWSASQAARALAALAGAGLDVPMFAQSFSERSLNIILRAQDQATARRILEEAFSLPSYTNGSTISLHETGNVATISVVGSPEWHGKGAIALALEALGTLAVRVYAIAQDGAACGVTFCIPESDTPGTVRALHEALGLGRAVG